jgi:hypothetical protein
VSSISAFDTKNVISISCNRHVNYTHSAHVTQQTHIIELFQMLGEITKLKVMINLTNQQSTTDETSVYQTGCKMVTLVSITISNELPQYPLLQDTFRIKL